eukprot:EG_transcript_32189
MTTKTKRPKQNGPNAEVCAFQVLILFLEIAGFEAASLTQMCVANDYVHRYSLHRSEGVLLRHLSSVYKVLEQTVPAQQKTPALLDAITYLESMIRNVDSSLIDEWTKLQLADPMLKNIKVERGGRGPRAEELVNLADDPERLRREFRTFALEVLRLVAAGAADAVLGRLRAASPDEDVPWSL